MKMTEPQTIALHAAGTKLVAIQPEGETWKAVAVPADGEVSVTIPGGPFTLVSLCNESMFDYYVVFGGTGNESLDVYCTEPPNAVEVSLAVGSHARVAIGPHLLVGDVSAKIKPGIYDVAAYDNAYSPPRFEIRRGVSITADTQLTFDLAVTGTPLQELGVQVNALSTESVAKSARLFTAGGTRMTIQSTEGGAHVWRVPASALQTGDRQTITASASTESGTSRSVTRAIPNTAVGAVLTLPAGLSSAHATFGPPQHVTWSTNDEWNQAFFYAADPDFTVMFDAFVTAEYVAQSEPLTEIVLPSPASVPGWDSTWAIPSANGLEWSLSLTHDLEGLDSEQVGMSGRF